GDWGTDIPYPENIQRAHFPSHETLCQPLVALDAPVGSLHMIQGRKDPEYMQRLPDRAPTATAPGLSRNMSTAERRTRTMQKWIEEWLQQGKAEFPEELVSMLTGGGSLALAAMGSAAHPSTPYESDDAPEDAMMVQIARMIHRAFKPYGLHVWMAPREE